MAGKDIRKAARTIIFDKNTGKIAILDVKNGNYHKIPGGGIEEDETPEQAAIREALEEGACDVQLIRKLGESEFESSDNPGVIHYSVCFLAKVIKNYENPTFSKLEKKRNFKLLWLPVDDAIKLFENVKSKIQFEIEMNNRDLNFIKLAEDFI